MGHVTHAAQRGQAALGQSGTAQTATLVAAGALCRRRRAVRRAVEPEIVDTGGPINAVHVDLFTPCFYFQIFSSEAA